MLYYFFSDFFESCPLGYYRYVPVHFPIYLNALDNFITVCFESAIKIMQFYLRHLPGDPIEEFRRDSFGNGIMTNSLPAANKVITVVNDHVS